MYKNWTDIFAVQITVVPLLVVPLLVATLNRGHPL